MIIIRIGTDTTAPIIGAPSAPHVVHLHAQLPQVVTDAVGPSKIRAAAGPFSVEQHVPDNPIIRPRACGRSGRNSGSIPGRTRQRLNLRTFSPPAIVCIRAAPAAPVARVPPPQLVVDGHAQARKESADAIALIKLAAAARKLAVQEEVVYLTGRQPARGWAGRRLHQPDGASGKVELQSAGVPLARRTCGHSSAVAAIAGTGRRSAQRNRKLISTKYNPRPWLRRRSPVVAAVAALGISPPAPPMSRTGGLPKGTSSTVRPAAAEQSSSSRRCTEEGGLPPGNASTILCAAPSKSCRTPCANAEARQRQRPSNIGSKHAPHSAPQGHNCRSSKGPQVPPRVLATSQLDQETSSSAILHVITSAGRAPLAEVDGRSRLRGPR